jgi:ubiquinone/menaquinone biosynthesis C-methylase UbiE
MISVSYDFWSKMTNPIKSISYNQICNKAAAKHKSKVSLFTHKVMKKPEDIQRQYYTETASLYDNMQVHAGDEHYVALKHISSFVNLLSMSSILDVGCGTGRGVNYFVETHPTINVLGIEPVHALIYQAIQKNGIRKELLVCGVGQSLPFGNASFDAVCEFGILHHVKEPNVIVREMIRVAKKAVFLSDCNRFGQGSMLARLVKLLLYKTRLWGTANFINTHGKGYTISQGDGLAYSYSVFDSFNVLANWADRLIPIPTTKEKISYWCHPLLTSSHILLCAIRE